MAVSLKGAFEQIEQEKERGSAILNGMTDAVVGVDRELDAGLPEPPRGEAAGVLGPRLPQPSSGGARQDPL